MSRLRPVFFLSVVYERELSGEVIMSPPEGYEARFPSREELLLAAADSELSLTPDFIEAATARGDVCNGMFRQGKLVAYMWRTTSLAPHTDNVWVETRKPYRYGYKAFTSPAYRGQHLPETLATICAQRFIEAGFTHHVGFVETHNASSHTSELRRGSKKIGYAGYVNVFGKIVGFRTPGVAKTGFRFVGREP